MLPAAEQNSFRIVFCHYIVIVAPVFSPLTARFSSSTDAGFDRYKFVVQVFIGEQRGQGVK